MANRWLSLEEHIERLLEHSFFRLFGGQLEPVDIAKRLGRAMEDGRVLSAGKTLAPNTYTIRLNPEDLADFAGYQETLKREFAQYLRELAEQRELTLVGHPQITFKRDEGLAQGEIVIDAALIDRAHGGQTMAFTAPLATENVAPRVDLAGAAHLRRDDHVIPLDKPFVTLGRSVENDIILESDDVSRQHAHIKLRQGRYVLTDLNSANGTYVNGRPVADAYVLHDGDRLRLAHVELIFELPDAWKKTS